MSEFTLIQKYFHIPLQNKNVVLGIGDDAAIVNVPENQQLVVCVDTIVAGKHFMSGTPADAIGHRALAVNLSDIAAMGATPCWFTLALTIEEENDTWLTGFSEGLFALAEKYKIVLIGGDTTQGPLSITIQVLGTVDPNRAVNRNGAQVGDKIYVSGTLGDAGLGLTMLQQRISVPKEHQTYLQNRYFYPEPRITLGKSLSGTANSMIDISDGLAADLQHILQQSAVGARIATKNLPLSSALQETVSAAHAQEYALTAGDDYELCFTVPVAKESKVWEIAREVGVKCTCIGEITAGNQLEIVNEQGKTITLNKLGWEFFSK